MMIINKLVINLNNDKKELIKENEVYEGNDPCVEN